MTEAEIAASGVAEATDDATPLLQADDLRKYFPIRRGVLQRHHGDVRAVDGVSFTVQRGQTLSIVGESGCGKSTTGRLIARLIQPTSGRIMFEGEDITAASGRQLRQFRAEVQIMFQDPYSSLSPRMTVHEIIAEPLRIQGRYGNGGRDRVRQLLELVGLSAEHEWRYPHDFSGGQRQRVGLARALALDPKVIVLDEPVSALDVSIRAQVINQIRDLQRQLGLSYIFISHDLSVVRQVSHRVAVMYLGAVVETGTRDQVFTAPQHPYTEALLSAIPVADPAQRGSRDRTILTGDVPDPANPPTGCRFRTRCPKAQPVCATDSPQLRVPAAGGHAVACHFPANAPESLWGILAIPALPSGIMCGAPTL